MERPHTPPSVDSTLQIVARILGGGDVLLPGVHRTSPPSPTAKPTTASVTSSKTCTPTSSPRKTLQRKTSDSIPIPLAARKASVVFKDTPDVVEVSSIWSRQLTLGLDPHTPEPVPNPFVRSRETPTAADTSPDSFDLTEEERSTPLDEIYVFQYTQRQEHVCCILQ
eukprot:TRINITY_DN33633_c0_g1_i1.p1 TRINITY_DN33633_c0_g1~~TRINITY_DN33633_c0_g1_i1.p1  ORF type:complete len:167 (-),score=17.16 TRINITY_DN33633_c0_g1_i1:486-986(-)